ncbi:MAG: hypothetical protein NW214_12630 [Pseudanabaenaceae cyanobacterium bins.39]|nr:hypothetical protein [Pseudanabaenaceae cyanobacterium bins.39]
MEHPASLSWFKFNQLSAKSLQLVAFVSVCMVATIAILPMFWHSYPITHSTHFNLSWLFQYQHQFRGGQFYPRWLEYSNFGFGNATFAFYPPICAIATLPFALLGMDLPSTLIGSMVLACVVLGWGTWLYAKLYFPAPMAWLVMGLAIASPYFGIDIYQRGAIAEVWGICWIPWILYYTDLLIRQFSLPYFQRTSAFPLAICWGMLGLSHLPTLLITFIVWLLMPLCLVNFSDIKSYGRDVGGCYLSAVAGFAGISFFLLPAMLDQKLVQINLVSLSSEYLPQSRLVLSGLSQLQPHFSQHWFESSSGMIPYFLMMVAIALVMILTWLWYRPEQVAPALEHMSHATYRRSAIFWLVGTAIALLMTTDLSIGIYHLVPIIQKIQFSWRWYGLTVPLVPLLWAFSWEHFYRANQRLIAVVLMIMAIASYGYIDRIVIQHTGFDAAIIHQFVELSDRKSYPTEPDATQPSTPILWWHHIFPDGLALVDVYEYRAKGVTLPMPPDRNYPLAAWQEPNISDPIQIQDWRYGWRKISVQQNHDQPQYLQLRMLYYPAWQVQIDGQQADLEANPQGQVQIKIPQGQHLVTLNYAGTIADRVSKWLSILLGLIAIGIRDHIARLSKNTERSPLPLYKGGKD